MKRWHAALARIGLTTPVRRDVAGAVLVAAVTIPAAVWAAPVTGTLVGDEPVRLAVGLVALESSSIALRRRAPLLALAVVVAAVGLQRLLLPLDLQSGFAMFVVVYSVAAYRPRATAAVAVVAAASLDMALIASVNVAGELSAALPDAGASVSQLTMVGSSLVLGYVVPALLGAYVRTRRDYLQQLEERAARLEHEREARAARAVADERARIARELHDVAAHHLSGILVQAGAADSLVASDPARARQLLAELRQQGRETLRSMRFLVGVLRASEEEGDAPQSGLDAVPSLVEGVRAAGAVVTLTVSGQPRPRRPAVDLAGYRIVQEGLTNARRHAPGAPTEVRLVHAAEAVHVEVTNGRPPAGPLPGGPGDGFGLVGMRERVELLGGYLHAGPTPEGGWRVAATLPLEADRRTVGADAEVHRG